MKLLSLLVLALGFAACSSKPIIMKKEDVKVSRKNPSSKCKDLGKITGTSLSAQATQKEVLEDLKQTAADKGANYVVIKQFSDSGTQVTAMAYDCP